MVENRPLGKKRKTNFTSQKGVRIIRKREVGWGWVKSHLSERFETDPVGSSLGYTSLV